MAALAWRGAAARAARGLLPVALAVLAVAWSSLTLLAVPSRAAPLTTHAAAAPWTAAADLTAGACLVAASLVVAVLRARSGLGLHVVGLAGVAWSAQRWSGWEVGPPAVRSIAMLLEPFFLAFVLHVVLATPAGRVRTTRDRVALGSVYTAAAVVSVGRAVFRDPFLDPYCWSNCRDNVLLVSAQPDVARVLDVSSIVLTFVVGAALVCLGAARMRAATVTARRSLWPVLLPGALLGAASVTHAAALGRRRLESPDDLVFSTIFQVRAWAAAALGLGVAWVVVRGWRAGAALARLAADLGDAARPGSFAAGLAQATGDPSLDVVYPLPADGRYASTRGATVLLPVADARRTRTPIVRHGEEVAVVLHDPAIVDAEQLRAEMGPAARLAIHNDRLQAEVLSQLDDLRASRARVVAAGDAERQRLERNLHDGLQQRLLALSYDLRLARTTAGAAGDAELAALLAATEEEVHWAIRDVRELAQGISPAVLEQSGLAAALWSLTDSAALPVELEGEAPEHLPAGVARAAFVVVSEAVDAARRAGAPVVTVRLSDRGARLVVEVDGAGPGPFVHLADRVGAVGGRLAVEAGQLRAELPCE